MMGNEAGLKIEEMLCQLADATRIDGEIWRAAYTPEDRIAKNILREWIEEQGLEYIERMRSGTCMGGFRGQSQVPY